MRKLLNEYGVWVILALVGVFCAVVNTMVLASPPETSAQRVQRIYNQLITQTGSRQMIPPVMVVNLPIVNAYNTDKIIVIYQGIIDACENDDQLALIIGHEMAHSTLNHFLLMNGDANFQTVLESQADKMGAYYIMRAGWDICKGRMFWRNMIRQEGDYLGADHPSLAYRLDQLNVGCE